MKCENNWSKFIERTNNFHWDSKQIKQLMEEQKNFYNPLCNLKTSVIFKTNKPEPQNRMNFLNNLFNEIYTAVTMAELHYTYFLKGSPLHDNVYNACFFSTLCMFLHETKRAEGKSLAKFVYENSLNYYNDPKSNNYCKFNAPTDTLNKESNTLRRYRHRLFSSRPAYSKRTEWTAMAKDSEHEWLFKYTLEVADKNLKDTFKRMGNLYNDIYNVLASPRNDNFNDDVKNAYEHFLSKVAKLKYENFLKLQKEIFNHFYENDKYSGINLYRIEKELRPYIITTEVNRLLICETDADKEDVLMKSTMLKDIFFPKVYEDFISLSFYSDIDMRALQFHMLRNQIIPVNCLIIDELVENKYLGEDWYDFLRETINEMAIKIFYDPKDIDYTITPKSQECYKEILAAAVLDVIFKETDLDLS